MSEQMAASEPLPLVERFQDQRFFLGAHSLQRPDAAVMSRPFEVVEGPDAEISIQRGDGLRSDALQVQQIEDRRRELGDKLAVKLGISGLADLLDPRRQILPDARDLSQSGLVEQPELVRVVAGNVCAVVVCADLERVLTLDLEEIGGFPED